MHIPRAVCWERLKVLTKVSIRIAEESVRLWMRRADIDEGRREGVTSSEKAATVQLRRRLRQLEMEMENEILRRSAVN
jgi:hypothetical protein